MNVRKAFSYESFVQSVIFPVFPHNWPVGLNCPLVFAKLTHSSLVMPYGNIDLGQHWLRQWPVTWWSKTIIRTNADLSSVRSSEIHLGAILQEIHQS